MHVFPDLKRLEKKYAEELAVVGIHSGKFPGERTTEGIREAAARYGIRHPIANDAEFRIWKSYRVRAWPTLWLIDTQGRLVGHVTGEGNYDILDNAISRVIEEAKKDGTLRREPIEGITMPEAPKDARALSYPGKVATDGKRLFIADSNHHRIVVADLDGKVAYTIGSGRPAVTDGSFEKAAFHWPQGLWVDGETLWVADTEGHALRRVDLSKRTVETVAGIGEQRFRRGWFRAPGKETPLNSPWDVLADGNTVYIAMAGDHRLWTYDVEKKTVGPFAGSGRENIDDGSLKESTFSQPSGLWKVGDLLYVADSEDSAIRVVDVKKGTVDSVVGTGLFDFGDVDGVGDAVRLQHPLAVVGRGGLLYVADTYNHRIKTLDPKTREAKAFSGGGKKGAADGQAGKSSFSEPSGLALAGDRLYVADTNNHRIRLVDLRSGTVSTLNLSFPDTADTKKEE
ncbi:MAG: alkyl hydroperoxide reductase [Planctomycetota bacterium]